MTVLVNSLPCKVFLPDPGFPGLQAARERALLLLAHHRTHRLHLGSPRISISRILPTPALTHQHQHLYREHHHPHRHLCRGKYAVVAKHWRVDRPTAGSTSIQVVAARSSPDLVASASSGTRWAGNININININSLLESWSSSHPWIKKNTLLTSQTPCARAQNRQSFVFAVSRGTSWNQSKSGNSRLLLFQPDNLLKYCRRRLLDGLLPMVGLALPGGIVRHQSGDRATEIEWCHHKLVAKILLRVIKMEHAPGVINIRSPSIVLLSFANSGRENYIHAPKVRFECNWWIPIHNLSHIPKLDLLQNLVSGFVFVFCPLFQNL